MYFTRQRLKITGSILQFAKYAKEFSVGKRMYKNLPKEDEENQEEPIKESPEEIRDRSFKRAKKMLIDLINSNVFEWFDIDGVPFHPVFLTLTFSDLVTDIKKANYEFTKFIRRLNWEMYAVKVSLVKYVAVIEFQKRGAIHYHVILFNMPFISKEHLSKLWGNGFIKIKAIEDIQDVGFYVTKYMSKDFDDPRLERNKCYFASKGLLKPEYVYFEELINLIKPLMPEASKEYEKHDIQVAYLAYMDLWRYNLRNFPEVKQEIKDTLSRFS